MLSEMDEQFEMWWKSTHTWDWVPEGTYESHAKRCFEVGWKAGYGVGYNACRDHWGGLEYSDPCNDFTKGVTL